ncbi:hypothetical protein IAI18_04535 [Acetobacteraceae bacterium H6797]|nr:hypothetical protein [Acetobacteraceae bacterium H6797]
MRLALLTALAALLSTGAAHALSGSITVSGRVVPLPPGEWQLFSSDTDLLTTGSGRSYERGTAMLIQESAGRLTNMVVVTDASTLAGTETNWSVPPVCTRDDTYSRSAESMSSRQQDCMMLAHRVAVPRPAATNDLWLPYWEKVSADPGWEPSAWVTASFREARPNAALTVSYHFSTEAAGFPHQMADWRQSPWHPSHLDDARRAFVERIQAWASAVRPAIREAFATDRATALPAP